MCTTNGSKEESNNKATTNIPILCRFWKGLLNALPQFQVFGLDVSLTIASALFLTGVRFFAEYILLVRVFGWPAEHSYTKSAAASCGSIFHSLNLVPALYQCFASHIYRPTEALLDAPTWWQQSVNALLQFCTGYMIYDTIINILWLNADTGLSAEDLMFLGHHIATTLYMTSTRMTGAGHQSAMMCMFLGELTNPFHNGYYVATEANKLECCFNGRTTKQLTAAVELAFSASYVFIRAVVAPVVFGHMTVVLWWKRNPRNPIWLVGLWTFLIWAVLIGSIPWVQDCWNMFTKYLPPQIHQALPPALAGVARDEL